MIAELALFEVTVSVANIGVFQAVRCHLADLTTHQSSFKSSLRRKLGLCCRSFQRDLARALLGWQLVLQRGPRRTVLKFHLSYA